ncbi:MAG: ribosomal RNA assembly protein [Candidatus Woesearchaeota archaeon]|jgi:ribosomal RNA assembly protein
MVPIFSRNFTYCRKNYCSNLGLLKSNTFKKAPAVSFYMDDMGTIHYDVTIPKARIAVLIGAEGSVKRQIEELTQTTIVIDSQEGEVEIEGTDVIVSFAVRDIIKAIGRGFNPDIALYLLKPDYAFELIDLTEYLTSKNALERVKGRIIGTRGKTRNTIEKSLEVHISVYGKTIGVIGEIERVSAARQAIEMILDGSPHANVYKWVEKKRSSLIKADLSGNKIEIKDKFKDYV